MLSTGHLVPCLPQALLQWESVWAIVQSQFLTHFLMNVWKECCFLTARKEWSTVRALAHTIPPVPPPCQASHILPTFQLPKRQQILTEGRYENACSTMVCTSCKSLQGWALTAGKQGWVSIVHSRTVLSSLVATDPSLALGNLFSNWCAV